MYKAVAGDRAFLELCMARVMGEVDRVRENCGCKGTTGLVKVLRVGMIAELMPSSRSLVLDLDVCSVDNEGRLGDLVGPAGTFSLSSWNDSSRAETSDAGLSSPREISSKFMILADSVSCWEVSEA